MKKIKRYLLLALLPILAVAGCSRENKDAQRDEQYQQMEEQLQHMEQQISDLINLLENSQGTEQATNETPYQQKETALAAEPAADTQPAPETATTNIQSMDGAGQNSSAQTQPITQSSSSQTQPAAQNPPAQTSAQAQPETQALPAQTQSVQTQSVQTQTVQTQPTAQAQTEPAAQASQTDSTLEALKKAVEDAVAQADAAVPTGTMEERRRQFNALNNALDYVDDQIDSYDDTIEAQYKQGNLSYADYQNKERELDALEDKLDAAEDRLELKFGIDD